MKNKHKLIILARDAINSHVEKKELKIDEKTKEEFKEKAACFVTLTLNEELRGCVGSLTSRQELWKDVVENALNAAFSDPRFYPLTKEEFEKIKIEISVLTAPKEIQYNDAEDLKNKIYKKGVIIKKDFCSATYLPQVWGQLPDKDDFLNSLCAKARLPQEIWKKEKLGVFVYDVKKIEE